MSEQEWEFLGNYEDRDIAFQHCRKMARALKVRNLTRRFGVRFQELPGGRVRLRLVDREPDQPLPFRYDEFTKHFRRSA